MRARLPSFFRSWRLLQGLNVVAMGTSLAALVGVGFGHMMGGAFFSEVAARGTTLSTLVVGLAWAVSLRWRRTVGKRALRAGWLLSVPLAMTNAALAISFIQTPDEPLHWVVNFFPALLVGSTFGVLFWLPGLIGTLLLFGAPIAWAQRQASRGLAGEERGEAVVGAASVLSGMLALALLARRPELTRRNPLTFMDFDEGVSHPLEPVPVTWPHLPDSVASWSITALALVGIGCGLAALAVSLRREHHRRRFVQAAEQGRAPGYRVEESPAGKVLVRVTAPGEQAYRSAQHDDEALFALDEAGGALHAIEQDKQSVSSLPLP